MTGFDSKVRKNRLDKGYFFTKHDKKYQKYRTPVRAPKRRVGGSNPLRDVLQLWDDLDINPSHSIFYFYLNVLIRGEKLLRIQKFC